MDIQHQDNKIKSKKLSNKDDNRNLGVLKVTHYLVISPCWVDISDFSAQSRKPR